MSAVHPLPRLGPRRLLPVLAAILVAIAMAVPKPADAAPVAARSAASFTESIGVDTHLTYTDTPYVNRFAEVKSKLLELGVHHIREDLLPNRPDQYTRLNELAGAGIGSTLIMGAPENGPAGLENLLNVVHTKLTGVDALEGPSEPYAQDANPNWTSITDSYQSMLFEKATTNPGLASLPIVGPTTIFWQDGELGNISSLLNYGDIHPYSGGYPPEDYLERHMDFAALSSGSKPLMATETGFHNAMNWTGDFPATSEAATAVYTPRIFLDYFQQGIARTFDYELVDEWPDPSGAEREAHFGLLRNDLSPKPSFLALKNLISIVGEQDESFAPGALSYSISGNPEKLHQVLLQKADGSFFLALWRSSSVWDPVRQVALTPPSAPVTIQLGQQIAAAAEYMPNRSAAPLSRPSTGKGALQVNVGPEVVILELDPTGAGPSTGTGETGSETVTAPAAVPVAAPAQPAPPTPAPPASGKPSGSPASPASPATPATPPAAEKQRSARGRHSGKKGRGRARHPRTAARGKSWARTRGSSAVRARGA